MAEKLNPEAGLPSEIESKANELAINDFSHGVHLSKEEVANTLNEYFSDGLHLDRLGNTADEHANWVYFGVGGPA